MTILSDIFTHKRAEVAAQKARVPPAELKRQIENRPLPQDFTTALRHAPRKPALIAEVKKASPSKGVLAIDFNPLCLARTYAGNGAAAISVLTDEKYFGGSLEHLGQIAALDLGLPLLRKEFICDEYQIYEARAAGADAVLLIAAELTDAQLRDFRDCAQRLGMAALVEVHTAVELERALRCGANPIGINNRNLHDFSLSLDTTRRLRPLIPDGVTVVSESGIGRWEEAADLDVDAVLVGEALVRAKDTAAKVRELAGMKP